MDLNRPRKLSSKKENAYNFFRDYQIWIIMLCNEKLNDTLNDYLNTMIEKFNMYDDRKGNFDTNQTKFFDHIYNFEKIKRGEEVSKAEFKKVVIFYEEILNYVDKVLGYKFYLGKIFTNSEKNKLDTTSFDKEFVNQCCSDCILFWFDYDNFNHKKYEKKYLNGKNEIFYYDDELTVVFDNRDGSFSYHELFDIMNCCRAVSVIDICYPYRSIESLMVDIYEY